MSGLLQGATWTDILSWLPDLWSGFLLSLEITFFTLLAGFPLGLICALGVQSETAITRIVFLGFIEVGRGAPALVMLQFIYFGLPSVGLSLSSIVSAVVALSWSTGAHTSEIIRAGLDAVPAGNKEAVLALGLSRADGLRYVILPQGLRVATPAMLGVSILVFQATSLCSTIAVSELISRAYLIGTDTFFYFPALVTAGLFYLAVCMPASFLVSFMERRSGAFSSH